MQELNELSYFDWIMIKIMVDIGGDKRFDCNSCMKKKGESLREGKMGCTGQKPFKLSLGNNAYLTKCPSNYRNPAYSKLISYFNMFQRDVYPYPGSYMDQPSKFINAMKLIANLAQEKNSLRAEIT